MIKRRLELEPKPDRWSYLWLAIGLFFFFFTFGKWVIPLASWLATPFFLRFMRTQRLWPALLIVAAASVAIMLVIGQGFIPLPEPMDTLFLALQVVLGCLPLLADRLLAPWLKGFVSTLVFPLATTAWEFANMGSSPFGSFGAQAYSQADNLALIQLVSLTGIWGVTFLMAWFASTVNWLWEQSFDWRRSAGGVAIYAGILALVLAYGYGRLLLAAPAGESIRIAGITASPESIAELMPLYRQNLAQFRRVTSARHNRYLTATVSEARAGAKIVNWPEGAAIGIEEDVQTLVGQAQTAASEQGVYIAIQAFVLFPGQERPAENKLLLIDPAGQIALEHVKYGGNFLEGTLLGDGVLRSVETPFGLLSSVICWDADFPATIRQAGRSGVDLMLIGANDWQAISQVHAQMSAFRAIENGMSVVRQAYGGVSTAVDPLGRVLASTDFYKRSEDTLIAQVPIQAHLFTLYPIIGDAFGWLTVVGFVVVLLAAVLRRRQVDQAP